MNCEYEDLGGESLPLSGYLQSKYAATPSGLRRQPAEADAVNDI